MIKHRVVLASLLAVTGLVLTGCKPKQKAMGGGPPGGMEMQVVAVEASRQSVAENISLVGNILANESVEIKSEIDGTIKEIKFQEGERVEKGQELILLDSGELAAGVEEAEATFKLGQLNVDRAKELQKNKLISQQEFDQITSTFQVNRADLNQKRELLKDTRITASFSGIIGARTVGPGQVISKNTVFTWLTDLDPVKVEINVPERFVSELKVGQAIEISVVSYLGRKFAGEVYFVSPQIDTTTRTALIKAKVSNRELELKPGMFANLDLTLKRRDASVVIPEAALSRLMDDGKAMIFVIDTNNTAQMRPVSLGVRLTGRVEILKGLDAGEKVIVEGLQKIGPGSKVKIAPPESAAPYQNKKS